MSFRHLLAAALLAGVTVTALAQDTGAAAASPPARTPEERAAAVRFELLQRKIAAGQATLAEVRQALTDTDIAALTNTVHALYSMRWHRGVYNLLHDMWAGRRDTFPEIQWEQFAKPPVRLALASTLLRTEPANKAYLQYLRDHREDEHEFHRAQVAVGLAFKAAVEDVDYIYSQAAGDNVFVAQTAITALGLMNIPPARDALLKLLKEFPDDARIPLVKEVLRRAYDWKEELPAAPAK